MNIDTNLNLCVCGHTLAEHVSTETHERGKCETAEACDCESFVPKHPDAVMVTDTVTTDTTKLEISGSGTPVEV